MSVNNNNNNISPGGQTFNNNPGEQQPATPAPAYNNDGDASVESDADDGEIDLHNKEFCVDVSTYQPVIWVERDGQECKTSWVKQCEDKTENVCIDVTETVCEVSELNNDNVRDNDGRNQQQ